MKALLTNKPNCCFLQTLVLFVVANESGVVRLWRPKEDDFEFNVIDFEVESSGKLKAGNYFS
jgi:hypothetical protein